MAGSTPTLIIRATGTVTPPPPPCGGDLCGWVELDLVHAADCDYVGEVN